MKQVLEWILHEWAFSMAVTMIPRFWSLALNASTEGTYSTFNLSANKNLCKKHTWVPAIEVSVWWKSDAWPKAAEARSYRERALCVMLNVSVTVLSLGIEHIIALTRSQSSFVLTSKALFWPPLGLLVRISCPNKQWVIEYIRQAFPKDQEIGPWH